MRAFGCCIPLFLISLATQHLAIGFIVRTRRRIHLYPLSRIASIEKNESSEENIRPKFILKCPRTIKNISTVIWTHNGDEVFSVDFASDGKLEAGKGIDPKWIVEEKVWRSLESNFGLILTANKGRYKVEVENGREKQWIALRINKPNHIEDAGEWRCMVFTGDSNGNERLEAESRKKIEGIRPRKTREFDEKESSSVSTESNTNRQWELWDSVLQGRTFGFAKSDGEFAVFERTDSRRGLAQIGDAVEYTRNDPVKAGELLDMDMNPWRWRRARSNGQTIGRIMASSSCLYLVLSSFLMILFTQEYQYIS